MILHVTSIKASRVALEAMIEVEWAAIVGLPAYPMMKSTARRSW